MIDVDADTVNVLASYRVARAEVSFDLATADASPLRRRRGEGELRSHDVMTRLRHTHATLLLESGEHPTVVQACPGHSTITATMNINSHVSPTMQKAAADRFAQYLGNDEHISQLMARK